MACSGDSLGSRWFHSSPSGVGPARIWNLRAGLDYPGVNRRLGLRSWRQGKRAEKFGDFERNSMEFAAAELRAPTRILQR